MWQKSADFIRKLCRRTCERRSDTLQPGRIELYLALTYDCAGREVYDRTDPVIYGMLRGPRP